MKIVRPRPLAILASLLLMGCGPELTASPLEVTTRPKEPLAHLQNEGDRLLSLPSLTRASSTTLNRSEKQPHLIQPDWSCPKR